MPQSKRLDMTVTPHADGRGWDVRVTYGVATVRVEGDHLAVRTPYRSDPTGWQKGRWIRTTGTRPVIGHLTYRAPAGMDPKLAVRYALLRGTPEKAGKKK